MNDNKKLTFENKQLREILVFKLQDHLHFQMFENLLQRNALQPVKLKVVRQKRSINQSLMNSRFCAARQNLKL